MGATDAVDPTDPTLLIKVRVPLKPRSLLLMSAVVAEHPAHRVAVEGEWLAVRASEVSS